MAIDPPIDLQVGDGVKIYVTPNFGREDAKVTRVFSQTDINVTTMKSNRNYAHVQHLSLMPETSESEGDFPEEYWLQLPKGYVPGSEGH